MASSTISLVQGVDGNVDLVGVQDDGTPYDLTGAVITETVRDGEGNTVLTRSTTNSAQVVITDGPTGHYQLRYLAAELARLAVATYLHDVKATLADGSVVSLVDPSFFIIGLGGVTETPPPVFSNTVSVDHDYSEPDSLRYMDPGGNPINDAQVRVYLKSDYDAKKLDAPAGVTLTRSDGRWVSPILVVSGFDYVVRFEAPFRFGPDITTITA